MKWLLNALIKTNFSVGRAMHRVEFLVCETETGGRYGVEIVEDGEVEFGWEVGEVGP